MFRYLGLSYEIAALTLARRAATPATYRQPLFLMSAEATLLDSAALLSYPVRAFSAAAPEFYDDTRAAWRVYARCRALFLSRFQPPAASCATFLPAISPPLELRFIFAGWSLYTAILTAATAIYHSEERRACSGFMRARMLHVRMLPDYFFNSALFDRIGAILLISLMSSRF